MDALSDALVVVGLPIALIGGLAGLIVWLRKAPPEEMQSPRACGWYLLRAIAVSLVIAWAVSSLGHWPRDVEVAK